jgi:GcrA cell cycle regulator
MIWTSDIVEQLRALAAQGLSARQIGDAVGASRNAVIGKMHRMGIPFANLPPKNLARASKPKAQTNGGAVIAAIKAAERRSLDDYLAAIDVDTCPSAGPEIDQNISSPLVALLDLKPSDCRWPIDDDTGKLFFCGCQRMHDRTPYCDMHHKIAYKQQQGKLKNDDQYDW